MLRSRSFKRQPPPERQPLAWPGVQNFAASPRCDIGNPITAQPKPVEHRNPTLLAMARDNYCLLRVPHVCNFDPRTTVACHSNWAIHGKSGARKADDHYSVWGCSACHSWLDQGKEKKQRKQATFMRAHLEQVQAWRRIAGDITSKPREWLAAHWALHLLDKSPTGEKP